MQAQYDAHRKGIFSVAGFQGVICMSMNWGREFLTEFVLIQEKQIAILNNFWIQSQNEGSSDLWVFQILKLPTIGGSNKSIYFRK